MKRAPFGSKSWPTNQDGMGSEGTIKAKNIRSTVHARFFHFLHNANSFLWACRSNNVDLHVDLCNVYYIYIQIQQNNAANRI